MLKITEKVTSYDIVNLTEEDYSYLKSLIMSKGSRGLPDIKFANNLLKREDLLRIYNITEEFLEEQLSSLPRHV